MNYTTLFYWLTIADNAKSFFGWTIAFLTIAVIISIILYFVGRDPEVIKTNPNMSSASATWFKWFMPFLIIFWIVNIATPNKKDALLIVAGGQTLNYLTSDSTARQIPHEALNFVITELRSMAGDAKVELNLQSQKEKILNEAKKMSANELIEKIKTDTTFAKIILDK